MCLSCRGRDRHWNEKVICTTTNKQSWKNCLILITTGVSYTACVSVCVMPCWFVFCFMLHLNSWINVLASSSLLQSTGSASASSQVPNWKAAPLPSTCATTCWSSPEASLLSPLATGNCLRCVDMVLCQMALFLREGLAADTVSNAWTERGFLTYEIRRSSLLPKRATLESSLWRNSHDQCAAFQIFPSESNSFSFIFHVTPTPSTETFHIGRVTQSILKCVLKYKHTAWQQQHGTKHNSAWKP